MILRTREMPKRLFECDKSFAGFGCITAVLLLALWGCCPSFDSATRQADGAARKWLRGYSGSFDWALITQWKNVPDGNVANAERLLEEVAALRLTEREAHDLVGDFMPAEEGRGSPYLLRAVGDARGKFPVEVSVRRNGDVWVGGGANSRCPVAMRRRAVVAWLDKPPAEVYLTFVVAR